VPKNQIDWCSHFDTKLACDSQTDGHGAIAITVTEEHCTPVDKNPNSTSE